MIYVGLKVGLTLLQLDNLEGPGAHPSKNSKTTIALAYSLFHF